MTGRFIGLHLAPYRLPAEAHHAEFRQRAGSEQIASAFAIGGLHALLDRLAPRRVLEVGSGIGTLTAILTARCERVHAVEDHAWCTQAMLTNLNAASRVHLGVGLGYLHDLIVVDGDQITPATALGLLKHRGWMLVEGNRRTWRAGLKYGYRPFTAVNLRPFDRSKGVWLLAFEPTPRLRLAFALERAWQGLLTLTSRAWSLLTGARVYRGKRRQVPA